MKSWGAFAFILAVACGGSGIPGGNGGSGNGSGLHDLGAGGHTTVTNDLAQGVIATPDLAPAEGYLPVGTNCTSGGDCGSGYCVVDRCACNKPDKGYVCRTSDDCCSPGFCSDGKCVTSAPTCTSMGAACTSSATCCVGQCTNVSNNFICQCLGGDRPCGVGTDCCSGHCIAPGLGGGGSYCGYGSIGAYCNVDADCTSYHCAGNKCACNATGGGCMSSSDCCSTTCTPSQSGSPLGTCN